MQITMANILRSTQVGGHFPIVCLDGTTVCKPLNDREHKFYQTMPDVLKPFAPSFEGTMKVETAEDEEGYIMLRGQPPPNYREVQLDFTPSIEVFYMLFERCPTKTERDLSNSL